MIEIFTNRVVVVTRQPRECEDLNLKSEKIIESDLIHVEIPSVYFEIVRERKIGDRKIEKENFRNFVVMQKRLRNFKLIF